jgi:hypothetical protein
MGLVRSDIKFSALKAWLLLMAVMGGGIADITIGPATVLKSVDGEMVAVEGGLTTVLRSVLVDDGLAAVKGGWVWYCCG